MPLDDDYNLPEEEKKGPTKIGSKNSIFDNRPRKPSAEDFERQVKTIEDNKSSYKQRAASLVMDFNKLLNDETLPQNRSVFAKELEKDILTKMISLAVEINSDPNEADEGGSINWITVLLKVCFFQRDKINSLGYKLSQLEAELKKIQETVDTNNGRA